MQTYSAKTVLDTTPPAFTSASPPANSYINTSKAAYALSESVVAGSITFTRTGGTEDPASPHTYNLTASDMAAGTHTINTGITLVNGAIYTISFDATDAAGNPATTVSNVNITGFYDMRGDQFYTTLDLTEGMQTIAVTATDAAGRSASISVSVFINNGYGHRPFRQYRKSDN